MFFQICFQLAKTFLEQEIQKINLSIHAFELFYFQLVPCANTIQILPALNIESPILGQRQASFRNRNKDNAISSLRKSGSELSPS